MNRDTTSETSTEAESGTGIGTETVGISTSVGSVCDGTTGPARCGSSVVRIPVFTEVGETTQVTVESER